MARWHAVARFHRNFFPRHLSYDRLLKMRATACQRATSNREINIHTIISILLVIRIHIYFKFRDKVRKLCSRMITEFVSQYCLTIYKNIRNKLWSSLLFLLVDKYRRWRDARRLATLPHKVIPERPLL